MESNRLIAEFMNYPTSSEYWKDGRREGEDYKDYYYVDGKYDECWGSSNFHVDDMAFGLSWDWLMPVVKKCCILNNEEGFEPFYDLCELKIATTYQAVVEFIKDYNKYICGSCGDNCNEYTYNEETDVDECNQCKTINQNN